MIKISKKNNKENNKKIYNIYQEINISQNIVFNDEEDEEEQAKQDPYKNMRTG